MKARNLSQVGLLLIGGSCSLAVLGDSVTPEEPEAFAPFMIDVTVMSPAGAAAHAFLLDQPNLDEGEILVGYLGYGVVFPESPWLPVPLEVEIPGLPPGDYTVKTAYMHAPSYDDFEIVDSALNFTVADTESMTQQAYAFFHTGTGHFFVTADEVEADGLLAQSGWEIVDFGFNVWRANHVAPAAAVPVCRFYSAQVNSHFYTGDASECTLLQEEDHGWEYEGIAFQALVPQDGACLAGTDPVWRLFNGRAAELDSNHRFVASHQTYLAMIAKGWSGEGVAFCSPPESAPRLGPPPTL